MRGLSASVALARPELCRQDLAATETAIVEARRGKRQVEVRIGVGPIQGEIPVRVLGHAVCIAEVLRTDLPAVVRNADRIHIFSSAPKTGNTDTATALRSLAAIAGALRLAGVSTRITLDLASPLREVPAKLTMNLLPSNVRWFENAAENSGNGTDPIWYAREHAAQSMFGDLEESKDTPLRITVGSAPEANFWDARMHTRAAAIAQGMDVAPALGLILHSLPVPWYSPRVGEPTFLDLQRSTIIAISRLDDSANPCKVNGNGGLRREARATRRLLQQTEVAPLVDAVSSSKAAAQLIRSHQFDIGPRLASRMETFQ
jgi:hypothetical protein